MSIQQNFPDSNPNRLVSAIFASAGRAIVPASEAIEFDLTFDELSQQELENALRTGNDGEQHSPLPS